MHLVACKSSPDRDAFAHQPDDVLDRQFPFPCVGRGIWCEHRHRPPTSSDDDGLALFRLLEHVGESLIGLSSRHKTHCPLDCSWCTTWLPVCRFQGTEYGPDCTQH